MTNNLSRAQAQDALQKAVQQTSSSSSSKGSLSPDTSTTEAFALFLESFREMYPDGTFNAQTVVNWANHMQGQGQDQGQGQGQSDVPIPEVLLNTYSTGKFLRRNQELLGIQEVGSYANRTIYAPLPKEA